MRFQSKAVVGRDLLLLACVALLPSACGGAVQQTAPVRSSGPSPAVVTGAGDIGTAVERYRSLLGPDNGGGPGPLTGGRREISWDGVPDELAAPSYLPGDFFDASTAPRARGALLSTPGTGLMVSARPGNPTNTPVRFGNINPTYPDRFKTFSPPRLFSPIGSNVVELMFTQPGNRTPAAVRGFGAVYTDIDTPHTAFEYFAADGTSLGKFAVPIAPEGLSFLGVAFDSPIVSRVEIHYGTAALGPDDSPTNDVAVMDDFIYGEPRPIH